MFPYVEWKTFMLGPVTLQVWGLFVAIGIVAGMLLARREARRLGLDAAKVESLAGWTVALAFVGARLFHVLFYAPGHYLADPSEILAFWHGGFSSFGGFFGAAVAFLWKGRALGLPFLRTADALVPAAFLGLACGRIGCFLIHDHPGTAAHGLGRWLAVNFPDGPRYDLGLLLGLLDAALVLVWLLVLRRRTLHEGAAFAWLLVLYAPFRFALDALRTADVRWLGLTPGQYGSLLLLAIGLTFMRRSYAGTPPRHL